MVRAGGGGAWEAPEGGEAGGRSRPCSGAAGRSQATHCLSPALQRPGSPGGLLGSGLQRHCPALCSTLGPAADPASRAPGRQEARAVLLRQQLPGQTRRPAVVLRPTHTTPGDAAGPGRCPEGRGHHESVVQKPLSLTHAVWTQSSLRGRLPTHPPKCFSHTSVTLRWVPWKPRMKVTTSPEVWLPHRLGPTSGHTWHQDRSGPWKRCLGSVWGPGDPQMTIHAYHRAGGMWAEAPVPGVP